MVCGTSENKVMICAKIFFKKLIKVFYSVVWSANPENAKYHKIVFDYWSNVHFPVIENQASELV